MVDARATKADRHERVCAVVVTSGRRGLLRRCLTAIDGQRRPVDRTLVVDNASSDGTADMVRAEFPEAELLALERNVGGAGGFHHGMAWAHERDYDWLWLMDDDTMAQPDTLLALLAGRDRAPGEEPLILASQVLWKDGRLHPMNVPVPRLRQRGTFAEGLARGLVPLRYTSFVSLAVRREAVDRFGLPLAHYFIWGDDVEFTARVLRHSTGYLIPESRAFHWTETPHRPATPSSDRFYYHARNSLLTLRGSSFEPIERMDYGRYYARTVADFLRANWRDPRRLAILARAILHGLSEPTR
jgi:GT2 family glycosyltransferase